MLVAYRRGPLEDRTQPGERFQVVGSHR
jgi:hypothetical protein